MAPCIWACENPSFTGFWTNNVCIVRLYQTEVSIVTMNVSRETRETT